MPIASPRARLDIGGEILGWREWVCLPAFSANPIKAKVDTGARTSALHAEAMEILQVGDTEVAHFTLLSSAGREDPPVMIEALVLEHRLVRSSNGTDELRPVIRTDVVLGDHTWEIDITLTDREQMGFRMLLGRNALRNRYLVDPNRSFCFGNPISLPKESAS